MDAIQKTLIKAGRKDLAQKYYKKVTANWESGLREDKWITSKTFDEKLVLRVTWFDGGSQDKTKLIIRVHPKGIDMKGKKIELDFPKNIQAQGVNAMNQYMLKVFKKLSKDLEQKVKQFDDQMEKTIKNIKI